MQNDPTLFLAIDIILEIMGNAKKWAKNAQINKMKKKNAKMTKKLFRTIDIILEMMVNAKKWDRNKPERKMT